MKKKLIGIALALSILVGQMNIKSLNASSTITERKFVLMLMTSMKFCNENTEVSNIIETAQKKRIVKKDDKKSLSNKLTKERAAVYLNRTDTLMNGSTYDKSKFYAVKQYHRLSDLKKMKKASRASAIKMYCKGIMTGSSNGYYVQSRKFGGQDLVHVTEAKTYIRRLKYVSARKEVSPDGQLIRKTKLPKNASSFPYILATYPNSFYEKTFEYQKTKFHRNPVVLKDYASPIQVGQMEFYNGTSMKTVMDQYLMQWCEKVETNMKLRFNVDYRTIDTTWVNQLRKTYYLFHDAKMDKDRTEDIKEYVRQVKKDKVIIKSSRVTVEPSCFYNCAKEYIRVYVRFKIVSGDVRKQSLLYNEGIDITNLKQNKWIEKCFDIGIGSYNGYSNGTDFAVVDNKLLQA